MTQTIRRAARRHRFVIVDQAAIDDVRLSWAARGLLAYLLARPDNWKVLVNDLKKRGNLGRDGIYGLLRELREAGYVRFERNRDAKGRMRGGTYIVSEVPVPQPAYPEVANPEPAVPRPAYPAPLPNTDTKQRTTTTTRPINTITAPAANHRTDRLHFTDSVPSELHAPAAALVERLCDGDAQPVIDEWAGALAAGAIKSSPLGYLKTLAIRYQVGDMRVRYTGVEAS